MAFLTTDDYRVVTCPADLEIICQSSDEIRQQAERTAMEEVAGYVRTRYDIDTAFAKSDIERNPLLVQLTVCIAVFWMSQWLPMQREAYVNIYNAAIERLKEIQRGNFAIDIQPPSSGSNDDSQSPGSSSSFSGFSFGSLPKQNYPGW